MFPVIYRTSTTIFMRLPEHLRRECGTCQCEHCKGAVGYWDTLAVAVKKPAEGCDSAWTVHMPGPLSP